MGRSVVGGIDFGFVCASLGVDYGFIEIVYEKSNIFRKDWPDAIDLPVRYPLVLYNPFRVVGYVDFLRENVSGEYKMAVLDNEGNTVLDWVGVK